MNSPLGLVTRLWKSTLLGNFQWIYKNGCQRVSFLFGVYGLIFSTGQWLQGWCGYRVSTLNWNIAEKSLAEPKTHSQFKLNSPLGLVTRLGSPHCLLIFSDFTKMAARVSNLFGVYGLIFSTGKWLQGWCGYMGSQHWTETLQKKVWQNQRLTHNSNWTHLLGWWQGFGSPH